MDVDSPVSVPKRYPPLSSPHLAFQDQGAPSRTIFDSVENLHQCVKIRYKRFACSACEIYDENLHVLLIGPFGESRDNRTDVRILATPYHIPYHHHPERDAAQRIPSPVSPPNQGWSTQMQTRQTLKSAPNQRQSQRPEALKI